jgi:hypothetical protein
VTATFRGFVRCRPRVNPKPVSPRDGGDIGQSERGTNSAVIHRKRCSALKGLQSRPLESLLHSGRARPAGVFTPETPTQRRAALWNPAQRLPPLEPALMVVPPLKTPAVLSPSDRRRSEVSARSLRRLVLPRSRPANKKLSYFRFLRFTLITIHAIFDIENSNRW